jgi:hypothetical protein
VPGSWEGAGGGPSGSRGGGLRWGQTVTHGEGVRAVAGCSGRGWCAALGNSGGKRPRARNHENRKPLAGSRSLVAAIGESLE